MCVRMFFIGLLLLNGTGCRKSPVSAAKEPLPPAASQTEGATDTAPMRALLAELTQAVRKYAVEQQRAPKSIDEVVAAGYLSNQPTPPVGKKFAIDKNLQVYLTK